MSIYLDNAATTKVCPEAAAAALDAMTERYGNPSSTHRLGREAKALLDSSRKTIASALGCAPEEFYFTSCGSEGDNWAIRMGAYLNRRAGRHIVSSAVEHPAVLKTLDALEAEGYTVTRLKPEKTGAVSPSALAAALQPDTCLVTLMTVNNETGAVTDLREILRVLRQANPRTLFHTDAVQAFLKVPLNARALGADLITVSGHKVHAPKGIGGLYVRKGLNLPPLLHGGGQEREKRPGTEPLPAIAAFAAAVEAARRDTGAAERMAALRRAMAERLQRENPGLLVTGGEDTAPQILSISLPGWRSEVLMNYLEAREIYVSKSSACKKGGRSHVLSELGLRSIEIDGAIRVSLSRYTTEAEAEAFCAALRQARESVRPSVRRP